MGDLVDEAWVGLQKPLIAFHGGAFVQDGLDLPVLQQRIAQQAVVDVDGADIVLQESHCVCHRDTQQLGVGERLNGDAGRGVQLKDGNRRHAALGAKAIGNIPAVVVKEKAPENTRKQEGELVYGFSLPNQKLPLGQVPELGQRYKLCPQCFIWNGQNIGKKGLGIHEIASRA